MRCCKKPETPLPPVKFLVLIILLAGFCVPVISQADGNIQINTVKLTTTPNGYHLDVDANIALNETLERALEKGIVLYFVTRFVLMDTSWYWFDKEVARSKLRVGLRYIALTRQYHLSHETFELNFLTLEEALQALGQYSRPVDIKATLDDDTRYQAELRVYLDLNRLRKPFQVEALGSSAWNLTSETMTWRMQLPGPSQSLFIKGAQ